jgi:hypothetical protein
VSGKKRRAKKREHNGAIHPVASEQASKAFMANLWDGFINTHNLEEVEEMYSTPIYGLADDEVGNAIRILMDDKMAWWELVRNGAGLDMQVLEIATRNSPLRKTLKAFLDKLASDMEAVGRGDIDGYELQKLIGFIATTKFPSKK